MLAERVEEWTQTWKAQGFEEGFKQGFKEGVIVVLERLFTRRFGPLPANLQVRLHAATIEQLRHWVDQDLDNATLEDIFSE